MLKNLAKNEEESTDYDNLFFKTGDCANFLKRLGTLYDLSIDLLDKQISTKEAKKGQTVMIKKKQ